MSQVLPQKARRAPVKLTQQMINRLQPPTYKDDGKDAEEWYMDADVKGLGVRVRSSGKKTFVVRYFNELSQHRKHTIGDAKRFTLEVARKVARQKQGDIAQGQDPNRDRNDMRKRGRERVVSDLGEKTIAEMRNQGRSEKYIRDNQAYLTQHIIPAIGVQVISEVDVRQIQQIISKLKKTPTKANRVRSLVKRMFSLAKRWGYRTDDPTAGLESYSEQARSRVLTDDELSRLATAMDASSYQQSRNAALLVLLTGSRPQEVFSATWEQFDLAAGVWVKPAQAVKQKRDHRVQLAPEAVHLLEKIKGLDEEGEEGDDVDPHAFLFPSDSASGHIQSIKTFWAAVTTKAKLQDVRLYDLRRTLATRLMASGADLATVMQATGHTTVNVLLRHYAHAVDDKQKVAVTGLFKVNI